MEKIKENPSREGGKEQNGAAAVSSVLSFVESNINLLLGIFAGIIALVVIVFLYSQFVSEPRKNEAKNEIFKAQQMFARDSFEIALNGKPEEFMGFLDIIDEYGSTPTGNLAYAYAGICYKRLGDNESALTYLNKFSGEDELVSPAIIGSIADCYWDMENPSKALDYYLKAADKADNGMLTPLYKKRAAMVYISMGKNDQAIKLLESIVNEYPNYSGMMDVMKFLEIAKQGK